MPGIPVVRLLYFSAFRVKPGEQTVIHQLNEIRRISNRNNEADGITGALVFDSDWFLQVLEGERAAVWSTFKRIERDPRHGDITLVEMVLQSRRHFGDWWMGCVERSAGNAATFAPYLQAGRFEPRLLSAIDMLALLADLAALGFKRELAASA